MASDVYTSAGEAYVIDALDAADRSRDPERHRDHRGGEGRYRRRDSDRAAVLAGRRVTVRASAAVTPSVSRSTARYAQAIAIVRVGVSRRVSRAVRVVVEVTPIARRITALTRSAVASVRARLILDAALVPKSVKRVTGTMRETGRLVGNRARALLTGDRDRDDIDRGA